MPMLQGQLAGDDRGTGAVAVIKDVQQVASVLVSEHGEAPMRCSAMLKGTMSRGLNPRDSLGISAHFLVLPNSRVLKM